MFNGILEMVNQPWIHVDSVVLLVDTPEINTEIYKNHFSALTTLFPKSAIHRFLRTFFIGLS
jgi:hypothetical protein